MIELNKSKTNKYFLLSLMCLALTLSLISFAIWPIFLVHFRNAWQLNNTEIGWISGSYFIGYLTLTPIYVGLTDKIDAKWIFVSACLTIALSCIGLLYLAKGFWSTCILWGVIGSGLAGTYMPGLQILNSRLNLIERVKITPWYTSCFGLGTGASFAVIGYIFSNYSWEIACAIGSTTAVIAGLLVTLSIPTIKIQKISTDKKRHFLDLRPAFNNKEALSYILSYCTHTYELFAFRAWIFAFFVWVAFRSDKDIRLDSISFIIAVIMVLGMVSSIIGAKFCLDYGRRNVLILIGGSTFIIAFLCGILVNISFWILVPIIAIYNIFIMLDSGALTAGTVSASKDDERGAILAVHSIFGFGAGAIAGPTIGFVLDLNGGSESSLAWTLAFITMGVGSLLVLFIQIRAKYTELLNS